MDSEARDATMTRIEAKLLLKLCDKIPPEFLMEFGAYLIACAFHKRKPTQGTKGCTTPSLSPQEKT